MRQATPTTPSPGQRRLVALSMLCLLILACISESSRDDQPRNGWWTGNGIVVPHDSFPADCGLCHVEGSWTELRGDFEYDHEAQTGVALEGAHAEAKCLRCHNDRGPVKLFSQLGCRGCHEDVHRRNLGDQCVSCHDQDSWILRDEVAVHNRTRFPLVGAHAAAQCWTCHPGGEVGNWSRVDVECVTCHARAAAAATDPNHVVNGWVAACDRCHIPTTWDGAGFNHFSFPLTGAHASADCGACHVGDVFTGLPTDCAGCHTAQYNQTTDPNHVLASFPMACELCHDTGSWTPASMNHAGITTGCAVCHLPQYNQTTSPNHAVAGFPTSCEACHTTHSWIPANFDHNFPITSGAHSGFDCADCHTQPGNSQTFSCIDCHTHNQADMADKHDGLGGYSWTTSACYGCHPSGQE